MAIVNIANAQTEMSIKVGANYSNIMFEGGTENRNTTQFKPGLHVGISADIPIRKGFYIQPSLRYSRKGFEQKDSWFAGSANNFKVTVSYFELPVNFLHKSTLGNGKLLLGAGPYLGYGIGGKWESEEPIVIGDIIYEDHGDVIFKNDVMDGEANSYLYGKPWDYGANFLLGYEFFDTFSVQFNVQLGLSNLKPNVDGANPDGTFKNIGFGVSFGYKL